MMPSRDEVIQKMAAYANKLLRTLIGLPFVLVLWPVCAFLGGVMLLALLCVCIARWVAKGIYTAENWQDRQEEQEVLEMLIGATTLPYQFLKRVWK